MTRTESGLRLCRGIILMNAKLFFYQFFWLVPFLMFWTGYQLTSYFVNPVATHTPYLIGKQIHDVLPLLSAHRLHPHVTQEKEEVDMLPGTILHQTPRPRQTIRQHQSIFLVTSKHPPQPVIPNLQTKPIYDVEKELKKRDIRFRRFDIPSAHPSDICLGHTPGPQESLGQEPLIIYVSRPAYNHVIIPSYIDCNAHEAVASLKEYNVPVQTIHRRKKSISHSCRSCTIVDQRPLAGSFLNVQNPQMVYLYVQ